MLTTSVSRQAGGLFGAVSALARNVHDADYTVEVYGGMDEATDTDLSEWFPLSVMIFPRQKPTAFGYMPGLLRALKAGQLDVLHAHGIWMYTSLAVRLWSKYSRKPRMVSPHGMLDPWALRRSVWKKWLASVAYEKAHLRAAACLHALCISEYESIRAYGLRNPVAVIPNGVNLPDLQSVPPQPAWAVNLPADCRVLLFLSRIHPKKGLINLLRAWAETMNQRSKVVVPWQLVIAGWDQGGHQTELEQLTEELGIGTSLHFVGPQFDDHKAASLSHVDAFVLPSFSEGLPVAVLEAWSYRLPVLMTPQCNLPEGFETKAAISIEPETNSISEGLMFLFNTGDAERMAMGQRGRELVEARFSWPTLAHNMRAVYSWVLGRGPQPGCVITD